jgi:hypothetical protein
MEEAYFHVSPIPRTRRPIHSRCRHLIHLRRCTRKKITGRKRHYCQQSRDQFKNCLVKRGDLTASFSWQLNPTMAGPKGAEMPLVRISLLAGKSDAKNARSQMQLIAP